MADIRRDAGCVARTTGGGNIPGLDSDNGRLASIEALVSLTTILLTLLVFFGPYRRRCRNRLLREAMWTSFTISFSIMSYTVGLMQNLHFCNRLFPIWAVFLFYISISAYSVGYNEETKRKKWRVVVQLFLLAWLLRSYTETASLYIPLGLLLVISMIKIRERTIAFRIAKRSFGLESKIKLIADFMSYEHEWSNEDHLDPVQMKGYHYIVTGEDETELEPKPPLYLVPLKKDSHKVVTTQMVWECDGELLINDDPDGKLKDLCLSFALFKLLRRQFAGYPLHECQQQKTWRFVHDGLLYDLSGNESYDRAFRVIKVELAFLFDFLYTKYHVIFTASIPKRKIIEFLVIIVCCGMVASELNGYHAPIGSINLGDVDVLLTCLVVIAILMLELFEWVTIVFSDWMKVVLISKYVQKQSWRQNRPLKKIIEFICRRKLLKRWEKKMGQYSLLQSYDYNPPRWLYMVDLITLGSIDLPKEGQREDTPVKVAKQVKKAILQLLKTNNGSGFSNGSSSLVRNERRDLLWACHLETHTHTILVWHIATSICENQWNFGDAVDILVATTLSKYCAYLVAFVPALLPNHAYATECIFDAVVDEARIMLKGWKSVEERCDELMGRHETEMGNRVGDERPETIMRRGIRVWKRLLGIREDEQQPGPDTVIAKGAKLAKQLLETRLHFKWKILADFWVELMLFIAPSDNAEAHVENLANGGEFITHLWALLSHAGIIDRSTSPQYAHP